MNFQQIKRNLFSKVLNTKISSHKFLFTGRKLNLKNNSALVMFPSHRPAYRMDFNSPYSRMHFGNRPSRPEFNSTLFGFNNSLVCMDREYSEKEYQHNKPSTKVHCGQLRAHHAGLHVEISGKVHKQRLGRFLTLKDSNGMTQCIVPDDKPYLIKKVSNIPIDSYMVIHGTVSKRPKNQRNTIMSTGNVEVFIDRIQTLHAYRNSKESLKNISLMQLRQASSCANSLGVTGEEFKRCSSPSVSKKFSNRTHNCGELNAFHKNLTVTLCGWIESKNGRFLQLRDGYGLVQTVIPAGNDEVYASVTNINEEALVEVKGTICMRPEAQINNKMPTGHIEVQIQSIKLINTDEQNDLNRNSKTNINNIPNTITSSSSEINVNSFTTRTHNCGQLRDEHIGQEVTLCGWLEFHRVGKFIILRDGNGRTQLIVPEDDAMLQEEINNIRYESILEVTGVVVSRPPGTEQPTMSTGRIEVVIQKLKVLNHAERKLPFNLREFNKAKEPLRMQYRYLDLRYAEMQRNLRTRSKFFMDIREFLINQAAFVDVETPTLFRPTPGGAQEFIVPTRFPGQFYSLVQSPQQFKQLLMAGAIDRYFQIARCYRDEGARSDRQPEFTQLDIEMSFTTIDGIIDLVERLLKFCWPKYLAHFNIPFDRMTYNEAMETYGSDKPDMSFSNKLVNCTDILRLKPDLIKDEDDFDARALVFRKPFTDLTASVKNKYSSQFAAAHPNTKLIQNKFKGDTNDWITSISKLLGDEIPKKIIQHLNLDDNCVLFLAYGNKTDVCSLLGKIRTDFAKHLEERGHEVRADKNNMTFTWIVDFPLFEKNKDGSLATVHHPFTAPHPQDLELLDNEPLKMRSQAYDLVLNGNEIAGGSIRIHDPEEQKHILDKLHIPHDSMQHLLSALASGCPPHGGIALGLDRLLSIMLKTNSIRDVIAFPKGLEGRDPVSGAPVPISENDKKLYHIDVTTDDVESRNTSIKN